MNQKVSGQPDVNWVLYTLERHLGGSLAVDYCLSLGCGRGRLERELPRLAAAVRCDALDVAAGGVFESQTRADEAGYSQIHYAVQDTNETGLTAAKDALCPDDGLMASGDCVSDFAYIVAASVAAPRQVAKERDEAVR